MARSPGIPSGLLDPREVARHRRAEPDRVPKLPRLDAGDDLTGLIDHDGQLGVAADVQPPEPLGELREVRDARVPEDLGLAVPEARRSLGEMRRGPLELHGERLLGHLDGGLEALAAAGFVGFEDTGVQVGDRTIGRQ